MEVLFCTITTKYRLHQCVAMYHSLKRCLPKAVMAVLAVDAESEKALNALKLPELTVIPAGQLEDEELKAIKAERNSSEYCWTLKPVLLLYLYEVFREYSIFAYIDSDLFFFDNPLKLFRGLEGWSVILTTHKVNRRANGGFVAFSRSIHGYKALKWWRDRCLEWCYSYNDNGRFADQGYLDFMRKRFKGVIYLDMPGANVATWNYFNYEFSLRGRHIYADKGRLIFFHFSGLRLRDAGGSVVLYGAEVPCLICGIYSSALRAAIKEIEEVDHKITEYFYSGI